MLASVMTGLAGLKDMSVSSKSTFGYQPSYAKRNRTPNKSNKRTYDFVSRLGEGKGEFRCKQTGELVVRTIVLPNKFDSTVDFYNTPWWSNI